ncbi:hypothetical protein GCM10017786_24020 [Amycolatopsis deserti]|uniref:Secreted protein n=1 Tax=Amycolatopsis deserti TaxID=185696 RepID=A0ABQ3IPV6_9PSEU|nr:hypothetical protein [Amycolatopsis deserti]GHE90902.1 hypothetical protein GCM10017786_24020 [Amycolatopsis deserti]
MKRTASLAVGAAVAVMVAAAPAASAAAPVTVQQPCGKYATNGYAHWMNCSSNWILVTGWDNLWDLWHCWGIPPSRDQELGLIDYQYGLDYPSIRQVSDC